MKTLSVGLLLAALLPMVGCEPFTDHEGQAAIARAERTFASLPTYPGAHETANDTGVARANDGGGPVTSGGVRHDFELPPATSARDVERFFRPRLRASGWRLVERLPGMHDGDTGPVLNFRRGSVSLSVNLEGIGGRKMEIGVGVAV